MVGLIALYFHVSRSARTLPENHTEHFLESGRTPGRQVLVCVGDSITHGRVSSNYVELLSAMLKHRGIDVVNAGINSELAWNVLQRIERVVACNPDFVTILIGTNDANATLMDENMQRYIREMNLPRKADLAWYRENIEKIIQTLQTKTHARIALISLPPIGEQRDHEAYRRSAEYSRVVLETAEKTGIAYLPLHETMDRYLQKHPHRPRVTYEDDPRTVMYKMLFSHFVLGKSFDRIADENGQHLLIDILHLNGRGAAMIADLAATFVLSSAE